MGVVVAAAAAAIVTLIQATHTPPHHPASFYLVYPLKGAPHSQGGSSHSVGCLWKLTYRHAPCSLDNSRSQQIDSRALVRGLALSLCMEILSIKSHVFSSYAEEPVPAKPSLPVTNEVTVIVCSLGHLPCSFALWTPHLKSISHKPRAY